ncbi:uncharacterized protein LOC112083067 [Eutrema salsugineum]|uniref:uncharacterized protein LOC112083067 n=1 Tax=Eutrema salsugineum TaxID=72664 RepID=UPI000CED6577|nr:uncharacterized protein LOC112083067 [Eutrema salsugineum]
MTCFKLPKSLYKRIQSALTRFWWDSKHGIKKMCWVTWNQLTCSKKDGGLGFGDIESFNDALLAKISWNLGKAIGNGESTNIWYDSWLSSTEPLTPTGPPTEASKDLKVSDLIEEQSKDWNTDKINELFPDLLSTIKAIKPSKTLVCDSHIWLATKSGNYSTKTGYHLSVIDKARPTTREPNSTSFCWNSLVWQGNFSPKMKTFLWKIIKGALPTGENLSKRGFQAAGPCLRCGEMETAEHLFLHCSYTKKIWDLLPFSMNPRISDRQSFIAGLQAGHRAVCLPPTGITSGPLFPWVCWQIWRACNALSFEIRISEEETMIKAIVSARDWQTAQIKVDTKGSTSGKVLHSLPTDTVEIFSDAAWKEDLRASGSEWIINRNSSTIHQGSDFNGNVSSPLVGEALAVRSALEHAARLGFTKISLKSDCQTLINAITRKESIKECFGILGDIENLISQFQFVFFSLVSRTANSLAVSLAKNALACTPTSL